MLNKNGKALLKINNSYQRVPVNMMCVDGSAYLFGVSPNLLGQFMESLRIYVGSGTTEPTLDDYNLENIDSRLSLVTKSGTNTSENASYEQNYIASFSATFMNETEDDITISEIGLIGESSSYQKKAMIARDLLDEPRTIHPGKTYTFSMTIG